MLSLAPLVLALPLLGSSQAHPQARALFEVATREYTSTDYTDALRDFQAAYAREPFVDILFNIAQCLRKLQRWHDATDAYRRYLREKPNAANKQEALGYLAEVESRSKDQPWKLDAQVTPAPLVLEPPAPDIETAVATRPAPPRHRWGALPWVLFGAAAVAASVAVVGAVEVSNYTSTVNTLKTQPLTSWAPSVLPNQGQAENWGTAALILAPVAAACTLTGALLIW